MESFPDIDVALLLHSVAFTHYHNRLDAKLYATGWLSPQSMIYFQRSPSEP